MPKTASRANGAASRISPVTPTPASNQAERADSTAAETPRTAKDLAYQAELAAWDCEFLSRSKDEPSNVYRVYELGSIDQATTHPRRLIATITVCPELSPANAERVATLMACAPALWRELQSATEIVEGCGLHTLEQVCDITHWLWKAAGRNPFLSRREDEAEEALMDRNNARVLPFE